MRWKEVVEAGNQDAWVSRTFKSDPSVQGCYQWDYPTSKEYIVSVVVVGR